MPPPPPAEGIASRLFLGPALRTQPDRRLVSLVRQGYETAFEEIVRRYEQLLGRYAAAIVPGHRAEDVTQDAFSKALLALRHSDAEIELRPWLFRIVRNTALNDIRDQPPAGQELFEGSAATGSALETALKNEDVADLMRRLRALPEPQRAAIVMRELEGLSHEEIAAALGVTGGAARQTIHRARQKLRDGVGLLVPMPALKLLLGGAAGVPAGAAAGTGVGGAAAGAAGGGGAAVGLKAAGAMLLVAGTVGTGVALEERGRGDRDATQTLRVDDRSRGQDGSAALPGPAATLASDDAVGAALADDGRGHGDFGEDRGGGNSGPGGGEASGDREGSRHGDGSGEGEVSGGGTSGDHHDGGRSGSGGGGETSGGAGSSGPGGGPDGGHSGDGGGGGSGSSGSGSSGSSEGPGSLDPLQSSPESSNSGPGSDSSGSGSSGSGGGGDDPCLPGPLSRQVLSESGSDGC